MKKGTTKTEGPTVQIHNNNVNLTNLNYVILIVIINVYNLVDYILIPHQGSLHKTGYLPNLGLCH